AHHAHTGADVAAVVLLEAGPALDGGGAQVVGGDEIVEDDRELGHGEHFVVRHAGRGGVGVDLIELRLHARVAAVELVGFADELGQIHGGDADAAAFEDFFTVADGVKRAGPGADGAQARLAQPSHGAADTDELR